MNAAATDAESSPLIRLQGMSKAYPRRGGELVVLADFLLLWNLRVRVNPPCSTHASPTWIFEDISLHAPSEWTLHTPRVVVYFGAL